MSGFSLRGCRLFRDFKTVGGGPFFLERRDKKVTQRMCIGCFP